MTIEAEGAPKRRGGRPPSKKRGTFTFRVTANIREMLEAAANVSGRPVSEEIEQRIEMSFKQNDILLSYFGSRSAIEIAQAIAMISKYIEKTTGESVDNSKKARDTFHAGMSRFLAIYFNEQPSTLKGDPVTLAVIGDGHAAAEGAAASMGLRSDAMEKMKAYFATPEGQAKWSEFQKAEKGDKE